MGFWWSGPISPLPAIDRSVSKGIMPLNTAARHKSRVNRHVREMA